MKTTNPWQWNLLSDAMLLMLSSPWGDHTSARVSTSCRWDVKNSECSWYHMCRVEAWTGKWYSWSASRHHEWCFIFSVRLNLIPQGKWFCHAEDPSNTYGLGHVLLTQRKAMPFESQARFHKYENALVNRDFIFENIDSICTTMISESLTHVCCSY